MPLIETATIGATLTIFSSILSIAASVKQLIQKDDVNTDEAIAKYKTNATDETILLLEDANNLEQVKALCSSSISPKLLDQLNKEATSCEQRYIDDRQKAIDSGRDADLVTAKNKGERCVCRTLKTMMDHNKGSLPDGDIFHVWFDTYNCAKHI